MRNAFVALLALFCLPAIALAQPAPKFRPPEIKKLHVGFQAFQEADRTPFKVGLWTPVYVEVFGGTDGIDAKEDHYLKIETDDSEGVGTEMRVPVAVEPRETRLFMSYVKTGHMTMNTREIRVTLHANRGKSNPRSYDHSMALPPAHHLYLPIGSRLTDLYNTFNKKDGQPGNENQVRHVVYETDVERLPDTWFGYSSVDLMVLGTENRAFLTALGQNRDRLKAIAQWVRRGGRLIVPIAPANQDAVVALLRNEYAWDPPIPVVPPKAPGNVLVDHLQELARWGNPFGDTFHHRDPKTNRIIPIPIATLDPGRVPAGDWTVDPVSDDATGNRPLVARVRYGLGQIAYMAISLEDASFYQWTGKLKFLEIMTQKLGPTAPANLNNANIGRNFEVPNDLGTELMRQLDEFDVTIIPFGYVALFIVLYILIVGPLDFFLLKYVLKRLEWTWITFPAVVLAVSVIAYFAAYALKGRDLKINKVDIVDFDLRTDLDGNRRPQNVHAYGQSFFTILSPRIQNYTIGLEPNPEFWGAEPRKIALKDRKVDEVLSVDLMSWMGRPSGGPNDMGRSGSGGFFRNAYAFNENASGLIGVPIPVWTTKAFTASWEQTLKKPPFDVDLVYHKKDAEVKLSGKLDNHLGVDLVDAWLIYDDKAFPVEKGLKSIRAGATPQPVSFAGDVKTEWQRWPDQTARIDGDRPDERSVSYDPTITMKRILFNARIDSQANVRNHLLRPLDLGWRIVAESDDSRARRTREAILFARVRPATGSAESLTNDAKSPPPTKLWLSELPETGTTRRPLVGRMNQDTYVRVLLPVRPADE